MDWQEFDARRTQDLEELNKAFDRGIGRMLLNCMFVAGLTSISLCWHAFKKSKKAGPSSKAWSVIVRLRLIETLGGFGSMLLQLKGALMIVDVVMSSFLTGKQITDTSGEVYIYAGLFLSILVPIVLKAVTIKEKERLVGI